MRQPSSLEMMREEADGQAEGLRSYHEKLASVSKLSSGSELLFTGSGDSYSAALWAQELAFSGVVGYDPLDLAIEPSRAKDKDVIILSVTGKTRTNIFLAEKLRGIASKRIAVMSSKDSPLGKVCDDTLLLEYTRAKGRTAGTASYSASLLACSYLLGKMPGTINPDHMLNSARNRVERIDLSLVKDSMMVFVGSKLDYPLAMYGSLKFNEVLGLKSIACTPEQLVHAIIFSLDKEKDHVLMMDSSTNRRFHEIKEALSHDGFSVHSFDVLSHTAVTRSLEITFHLQYLAHRQAIKMGLKECAFLTNKDVLKLSSELIY